MLNFFFRVLRVILLSNNWNFSMIWKRSKNQHWIFIISKLLVVYPFHKNSMVLEYWKLKTSIEIDFYILAQLCRRENHREIPNAIFSSFRYEQEIYIFYCPKLKSSNSPEKTAPLLCTRWFFGQFLYQTVICCEILLKLRRNEKRA